MLFLLFELGRDRYVLDIAQVIEVLPLVDLKKIPLSPAGVAGLFNYRGEPVPVVDVCEMLLARPARRILSTRIVLVRQPDGKSGERLLGLIVEKAIRTLRRDPAGFTDGGVTNDNAPCLGPVATDPQGVIQWIDPGKLLSDEVREVLFRQLVESP
jgi:chemotaxis-related protein WspB